MFIGIIAIPFDRIEDGIRVRKLRHVADAGRFVVIAYNNIRSARTRIRDRFRGGDAAVDRDDKRGRTVFVVEDAVETGNGKAVAFRKTVGNMIRYANAAGGLLRRNRLEEEREHRRARSAIDVVIAINGDTLA